MMGRAEAEAGNIAPQAQLRVSFAHAQKLQRLSQSLTQIESEWNHPEEHGCPVKILACGAAPLIQLTSEGRTAFARRIAAAWAGSLDGVADDTQVTVDKDVLNPDLSYRIVTAQHQQPLSFKQAFSRLGIYLPVFWHCRGKEIDQEFHLQRPQTPSEEACLAGIANRGSSLAYPIP
jgi:hypothetical protein